MRGSKINFAVYFIFPFIFLLHVSATAQKLKDLSGSSFYKQGLPTFNQIHTCRSCDFQESVGPNVDLGKKNLESSNFTGFFGERAQFEKSNLMNTKFTGAKIHAANFRGAQLQNVDFSMADLSFADLRGANLKNARFEGAFLMGTKFDVIPKAAQ